MLDELQDLQDAWTEEEVVRAMLEIYQKKGHLTLSNRTVIGERVYDPAHYTLTHAGPAFGRAK